MTLILNTARVLIMAMLMDCPGKKSRSDTNADETPVLSVHKNELTW